VFARSRTPVALVRATREEPIVCMRLSDWSALAAWAAGVPVPTVTDPDRLRNPEPTDWAESQHDDAPDQDTEVVEAP
jgi:hypothetical protein